eukprot:scaffold63733_cov43-Prasinocladus_malaysianus.AAC.1
MASAVIKQMSQKPNIKQLSFQFRGGPLSVPQAIGRTPFSGHPACLQELRARPTPDEICPSFPPDSRESDSGAAASPSCDARRPAAPTGWAAARRTRGREALRCLRPCLALSRLCTSTRQTCSWAP